jgi:hypothetical protein
VIARKHAEAARIDRQRLVQRKLGGEVGDRFSVHLGDLRLAPGLLRRPGVVEAGDRAVVVRQPFGVVHRVGEPVRRHQLQHPYGVVRGLAPQRVIERPEDAPGVRIPAPPEIVGELFQPVDAIG